MRNFWQDFKKFITKGNVLDLAVATIVGASFTTISTTFTQGIIMPLVNLLFKVDLSASYLVLKPEVTEIVDGVETVVEAAVLWRYGDLIQSVLNFLIIALFLFILIRIIAHAKKAIDVNANLCEIVQKKFDNDEELTDFEEKWLVRYAKRNPDLAPKRKVEEVVEEPKEPELTQTEKLLTEILAELKSSKGKSENK